MSTRTSRGGDAAKPLRTLIADDEPRARQYLEKLLGEHESLEVVEHKHLNYCVNT